MVNVTINAIKDEEILTARRPIVANLLKLREEHARHQDHDYSHVFRARTSCQLARLSAIAMAIEFAYAAETSFVSPILLQIGVNHHYMTMAWGLSPLIGFFLSPFLGSLSDRCNLRWGRRRPIITVLSIGILAGLILVPWGKNLGILIDDTNHNIIPINGANSTHNLNDFNGMTTKSSSSYAVILTIIGMVLLDLDADTCQTPARTYLLDMCTSADQPRALTTFTLFAGIGGTIGYSLGAIDWESTHIGILLGGNIPTVFMLVTMIFIICYFITITTFREIPLTLLEKDDLLCPLTAAKIEQELKKNNNAVYYIKEELKLVTTELQSYIGGNVAHSTNAINTNYESQYENTEVLNENAIKEDLPIKIPGNIGSIKQYLKSILLMPRSMWMLSLTNLLCWMGHITYCLYFTDFVGEAVFRGDPTAPSNSSLQNFYEEGVRFGCWGLSIYALSCSIYSMFVNRLMSWLGVKFIYITGILYYSISMLILGLWPTKWGVLFFSISAGIFYGTLFTLPYILVASYHDENCFRLRNGENVPLRQARGLGTDVAIISSMVFVAQFVVALCMGPLIIWMQTTCVILYASTVLAFLAAIAAMFVLYI